MLVVGGGGSIGSACIHLLLTFAPASLDVVDQSENYLAELVRDLRSRPGGISTKEFRALPLDYGSPIMGRFLADTRPYDHVLNFAALKHVRSEKDVYSVLQLIDTNIVRHVRFKGWLERWKHGRRYFAVSTDKAANPTSLMGATKRIMEDVAFDVAGNAHRWTMTSARFANVAFSNGSLLDGFLYRLSKRQPLAVPSETKRYFLSREEAAQLCLLAAMCLPTKHIAIPLMDPRADLQLLQDIAIRLLQHRGYKPVIFDDEKNAVAAAATLPRRGRWPLLVTPLDTSGEKPYEEFLGQGERTQDLPMKKMKAIRHVAAVTRREHARILRVLEALVEGGRRRPTKAMLARLLGKVVPGLAHNETGKTLDERL